ARLHDLGGWGYLGTVWDQALFYIKAFAGFVLPGVFFGSPMYERVLIGDAPRMPGAGPLGLVAVAAFLLVALWGLVARRRSDGTLVAIYLLLFLALLAIYPPRQERLIWPLVPVLWVYAAVGILDLRRRLQDAARGSSSFYDRGLRYGIGGFVVAVLALQLYASVAVVATNISWWRGGDSFYEEQVPPGYFADWRRAGMEIAKLGQPWARVLTRHSDVGLTSQRLQDSMRFEEVSPAVLTRAIVGLPARYVAIASTEFRKVAPAHLFEESATFRFQTVWQGRGVRVFEVLPNREGVGSIVPDDLEGRIERCQSAIAIHPRRRDLRRRHVQLLRDARRIEEAVAALDSLEETLGTDARSAWLRGTLLLDLGRYDDAADALNRGILLPDVGRVERSLRRGITRAVEGKRRATEESPPARVRRLVDEAGSFLDSGLLRSATIWLNRAAAIAPGDPSVAFLVSRLDERSGNRERAVRRLERLRSAGHRAAAGLLEEWELERRLLAGEVKLPPSGYVRFAARRTAEGRPGRGLALLERAHRNWPQSVDVARGLGLSWWFHGRPDLAAPLLESVVKTHPGDRESIDALTACRRVLEVD
ncbi:MAG: tetratricopeptide repeat protein, partial [Acidobacteriota bacterium]|nr:tetratricopeptide repeat protein [Acidobacteriota bacterium]